MFPSHNIKKIVHEIERVVDAPSVLEGSDIFDLLCPVSKLTGHRENPLSLLKSLMNDPVKSRALESIMQELPTIDAPRGLSDDDLVGMMMDRLSTGTPAEDDKYRRMLESVAGDILNSVGLQESEVETVEEKSLSPEDAAIG